MSGEMVSIHYGPGETGWAELLEGGRTARIANVPFGEEDLTIDDVVELAPPWPECCERQVAGRVISRRFEFAANVRYDDASLWPKLVAAFEAKGWKLEGGTAPTHKHQGFASLAFDGTDDPAKVAEAAGVPVRVEGTARLAKRTVAPGPEA